MGEVLQVTLFTLGVALLGTLLILPPGVALGWVLARRRWPANAVVETLVALPLVIPRAHDCITLLLGSRQRYAEYFAVNPGTFYKSPGWIERDSDPNANPASITARLGMARDRETLAAQYGEDNADFLMDTLGDWLQSYHKVAFIDTGVGDTAHYLKTVEELARDRGWEMERVAGSRALLERLLSGQWPEEDFLVLAPGARVDASWDEGIICSELNPPEIATPGEE